MIKEINLPYIYDDEKCHKLINIKNDLYKFYPAEDWMPFTLTYDEHNNVIGIDTDGLGSPIFIGDTIKGYTVVNIDADEEVPILKLKY